MKFGVNIDFYYDGYKTQDINCVDLPLAACVGHFDRKLYFVYCFCYAYLFNWKLFYKEDWHECRKAILQEMGIGFGREKNVICNNLKSTIIKHLKMHEPVFSVVKYGALSYSQYYKTGKYDHGLIISDYDDVLKVFGIRDREIIREHINMGIFTSDILARLQIDEDDIIKIWAEASSMFAEEKSLHKGVLYYLYQDKKIYPIEILIQLLQKPIQLSDSQLRKYVLSFGDENAIRTNISIAEIENFKRVFFKSFGIILDTVKKIGGIDKVFIDECLKETYLEFLNERELLVDLILKQIMHGKGVDIQQYDYLFDNDVKKFDDFRMQLLALLKMQ